ncbi:hypothetical protein [Alkalicoccobacillus murimartini]|uniref:Uncharacterized protein n=1 Tax=Alkalicoccobacillus murimartini TaxID=171685 RepID=A0ABT9YCN0_9BACI|nr:hypothetical protein [Alkalicoccobacillus murimartini]MDQ0205609.1 hypothetical protein [Alkalicoccobacillus murimartini]
MKSRSNHFIVFLLPVLLMIVMAVGGYLYLKDDQTDEWSNADLKGNMNWSGNQDAQTLELSWEWPAMPTDGMFGDDYIGVTGPVEGLSIELYSSEDIFYEAVGTEVDNGWVVAFPTELDENRSLGNRGRVFIELSDDEQAMEDVQLFLLHTWSHHSPLEFEDATFSEPTFGPATDVPFWVEQIEARSYVN